MVPQALGGALQAAGKGREERMVTIGPNHAPGLGTRSCGRGSSTEEARMTGPDEGSDDVEAQDHLPADSNVDPRWPP